MKKQLYELAPDTLTPEERRAVIFTAYGCELYESPVEYSNYENNMIHNQAKRIERHFRADYNAGAKTAEKFFQFYALTRRSESEIRARIAEINAEIERAARALDIYLIYTSGLNPPAEWGGHPCFSADLPRTIKSLTNTSPKLHKETTGHIFAVGAWDALTKAVAEAYWTPELVKLSNANYIKALAFELEEDLNNITTDLNQLYINRHGMEPITLKNRALYNYFLGGAPISLKKTTTTTALRSFTPTAIRDVYTTFLDERAKSFKLESTKTDGFKYIIRKA